MVSEEVAVVLGVVAVVGIVAAVVGLHVVALAKAPSFSYVPTRYEAQRDARGFITSESVYQLA